MGNFADPLGIAFATFLIANFFGVVFEFVITGTGRVILVRLLHFAGTANEKNIEAARGIMGTAVGVVFWVLVWGAAFGVSRYVSA